MVSSSKGENLPMVGPGSTHALMKQYSTDNFNLLLPSQTFLDNMGPMRRASVEVVKVDPDPEAGDVYELTGQDNKKEGDKKVAFHAAALERIGLAAGITYNTELSRMVVDEPRRKVARVVARMSRPDGTITEEAFEKCIDLDVLEKTFKTKYRNQMPKSRSHYQRQNWNWPGDEQWIENMVERDLLQKEQFFSEMAWTGAKKRAVQHFIGLKGAYKKKELARAFVAVRVDFSPDLKDQDVKRALIEHGLGAQGKLYGGKPGPQGMEVEATVEPVKEEDLPQDYEGLLSPMVEEAEPEPLRSPEELAALAKEARLTELKTMSKEDQTKHLVNLMEKNSYDLEKDDPLQIKELWHTGETEEAIWKMEQ
jgi:hypothetical protein